jgi:hypothetical protein
MSILSQPCPYFLHLHKVDILEYCEFETVDVALCGQPLTLLCASPVHFFLIWVTYYCFIPSVSNYTDTGINII